MCVIGKNELTELIRSYKCIHPFDYSLLDGDGYILTVKEERTLHYLEHQNLVSNEVVFTPPQFVAHLILEEGGRAFPIHWRLHVPVYERGGDRRLCHYPHS